MRLTTIFLIVTIASGTVYGNTGQGAGNENELQSDEIAEAVKQEVFLKTAGLEPPELDGSVRNYGDIGYGAGARPQSQQQHHGGGIGHGVEVGHRRHHHPDHIGHQNAPHPRFRRRSNFKLFDSAYQKECNSYYGRSICYRLYTNSNIIPPSDYTCWRVGQRKRNCTEVENVAYLKKQGVKGWDTEIPESNKQPRESGVQPPRDSESTRVNDGVHQGTDKFYDPYRPADVYNQNDEKELNRESELGDEVSLTRVTRRQRRSSNIIRQNSDEFEEDQPARRLINKPKPDHLEDVI